MESIKNIVNVVSYPQFSFSLSLILFWLAIRSRKLWTRAGGLISLAIVTVFFVVSMFDPNFREVVAKPDNIPIAMMVYLVGFFCWLAMYKAVQNDEAMERGEPTFEKSEAEDKIFTWPDLVFSEFICMVILTVGMVVWSIVLRAPLEEPANLAIAPNPSKAPWYFLGLQEMLVYFDPWMAGVVLPGLIIVGLMALVPVDRHRYLSQGSQLELLWTLRVLGREQDRTPGQRRPVGDHLDQDAESRPPVQLAAAGELWHLAHARVLRRASDRAGETQVLQTLLRADGATTLLRCRGPLPDHGTPSHQDVLPLDVQSEVFRAHSRVFPEPVARKKWPRAPRLLPTVTTTSAA
jgi:hypothetical protein